MSPSSLGRGSGLAGSASHSGSCLASTIAARAAESLEALGAGRLAGYVCDFPSRHTRFIGERHDYPSLRRRPTAWLISTIASATMNIAEAQTFACGGIPRLAETYTNLGKVVN